jgi:iron complex outermembrane receptor protein
MRKLLLLSVAQVVLAGASGAVAAQTAGAPQPSPEQNAGAPTPTSPVGAQSSTGTAASAAPSSMPSGQRASGPATLGEIIVTAQRRSENLQKAAVTVDVVGGRDLIKNNINEPTDLGFLVPALTPTPGGFFLRGVGNFTPTPYADPAIAFNYDGVYIGRPSDTNGFFYDLQRVEVLKGPQGTLYGRNSTGGDINVIPEIPKLGGGAPSGYISVGGGNYGYYDVEGAVNLPVGDDTAIRLSTNEFGHQGYLSDGTSDEDVKAGRVQILHRFSQDLTVRIAGDYEDIGGAGVGSTYAARYNYNRATGQYTETPANLSRSEGLYDPSEQAFREATIAGPAGRDFEPLANYPYQNEKFYGVESEIDYSTPYGQLIVEPEYRHGAPDNRTAVPGFTARLGEDDEQYGVETRFNGKRIGIFDYTVGALYYHEQNQGDYSINQQALAVYQDFDQTTRSYAFFARTTAHLTDRLRLVGGVRYTNDHKTFDGTSQRLTVVCVPAAMGLGLCPNAPLFTEVPNLASETTIPYPAVSGGTALISPNPLTIDSRGDVTTNSSFTNDHVTYRGALEYDLTPRSLLYGSVETGFRSGGFSLSTGYQIYKPEYIDAYTVGVKNRFLDNRVQLNLEGFVWNYRDQQINHLGIDLAGQQGQFTQNIGHSVEKGGELETRYLLTPDTVLSADLQYLDATYGSFIYDAPAGTPPTPVLTGCAQTAISPTLQQVNCSGKQVYNSPKWTLNFGLEQTLHLRRFNLVGSADTQYKSSRYVGFEYLASELQTPTWQTNLELTLAPVGGPWSVQMYVHNVENDRYTVNANLFTFGNLLTYSTAPPRTFGGRVSLKF